MAANARKPDVVSFINLKGGVGKTALSVNFAAYCGQQGLKTLLIDLDPQANATFSCISVEDWEEHAANKGTVANLLGVRQHTSAEGKKKTASEVLLKDALSAFDLIHLIWISSPSIWISHQRRQGKPNSNARQRSSWLTMILLYVIARQI